jgi:hypothetical protein
MAQDTAQDGVISTVTPQQRTLQAATRLIKARMRQFVYQAKSLEDENTWAPMLTVESGFLSGASKEWDEVITQWDLAKPEVEVELKAILEVALKQAREGTIDLLGERVPNLSELLTNLPPINLVQREPT